MLKSILVSLALVCGITAKSTTSYDFDAPADCETSVSYQSCVQPATSLDSCSATDTPCSCSVEDLDRKCLLKYCAGPSYTYTHSFWMSDCTSLGYSYISANGDYISEPAKASATATAVSATSTKKSNAKTSPAATEESPSSSQAVAGAGSPTSGTTPTSSPANASSGAKPNDAGRAMGFPTGGMLALLATAAGAIAGMLLL